MGQPVGARLSLLAYRMLGDVGEAFPGTLFDIHCGGEDHIAVHHSNEIAQTRAAHGTQLANY